MSYELQPSSIDLDRSRSRERFDELGVFVTHALAVARSTDPMLAALLADIVGGAAPDQDGAWRGDRREGLELCQRLLLYVRQDVPDRRLDVSLVYISSELAGFGAAQQAAAPN